MQVSTGELAGILGVTERRIQQLENTGVFRRLQHGEWDLAEAVQGYVQHRVKAKPRQAGGTGKAEERLKAAKARREELKLAIEEGQLIPTARAIDIIDEALGMLRSGLAGVPARITRDMILRGKIEANIDAVLSGVAGKFAERAATLDPAEHADAAAAEDEPGPVGEGQP